MRMIFKSLMVVFGAVALFLGLGAAGTGDMANLRGDDATGTVALITLFAIITACLSWLCHEQVKRIDKDERRRNLEESASAYAAEQITGFGPNRKVS